MEKYKKLINSKYFRYILISILIVILILYYKAFFTIGVYFNDTFLKKEVKSDEIHFMGKNKYGNIQIIVKGKAVENEKSMAEVIFMFPNDIRRYYTVYFNNDEWDIGAVKIKDEKENTLFEGKYKKNNLFLYDKNLQPVIEDIRIYIDADKDIIYDSNYKVPFIKVVEFSLINSDSIRGDYRLRVYAVLLIFITVIDIKYPLLFFTLQHYFHVKDPEPTDFYIVMQRISWVIFPIIGIIMLIVAI